jgi:hypothetical protein
MNNLNRFTLLSALVMSLTLFFSCNSLHNKNGHSGTSLENKYLQHDSCTYKAISLPFNSEKYIHDVNTDQIGNNTPSYSASDYLIDYLRQIDYEGEEYQCFIIASNADRLTLLIWIPRGDSEYYLIVTIGDKGVISWYECGYAGDDNPIMFSIDKSFLITKYRVLNRQKDTIGCARIEDNGKIIAINN